MSDEPVVIIGLGDIIRRIRYLGSNINDQSLMSEIGLFLISQIQIRTAEGVDVDGNAFTPYSPGYALFRRRKGRSASRVNLFFTGSMMSAMTFEADSDEVTLFFQNTSDPSGTRNPAKAFFLNQERRFFAMSEEDRQGVLRIIDNHIDRLRRRR